MASYPVAHTRKLLKKIAHAINDSQERISTETLLAECQRLDPSSYCTSFFLCFGLYLLCHLGGVVVRTGGLLFEHFMEGMSSWTSHKLWQRMKGEADASGGPSLLDEEAENELVKRERGAFHGFVLQACASIGNKGKRQLFFTTFVAKYHGLSRMGAEIMAHYKFMMCRGLYETMRQDQIKQARESTRFCTTQATQILKFNNFSC